MINDARNVFATPRFNAMFASNVPKRIPTMARGSWGSRSSVCMAPEMPRRGGTSLSGVEDTPASSGTQEGR